MKKKLFITLGIFLVLVLTSAVTLAVSFMNAPKHPSDYHIGVTYEEALEAQQMPILAVFYVDWCGYCMKFMPKFSILSKLYKNKYNFVMINVEDKTYENWLMILVLEASQQFISWIQSMIIEF